MAFSASMIIQTTMTAADIVIGKAAADMATGKADAGIAIGKVVAGEVSQMRHLAALGGLAIIAR